MRNNVNKVPEYIRYRVSGLAPRDAAVAAGYAQSGIRVTTTRLEAREDVRKALRAGKRVGKPAEVDDAPPAPEGWKLKDRYSTPLDLMIDLMNNPNAPSGMRYQAAKDAMPYCHARKEGGKLDDKKNKADEANKGKFGAMPVPLRRAA